MLLSQLLPNKKIKDIEGEIIDDLTSGKAAFKVNTLIFDDGTHLQLEGDYGASCFLMDLPTSNFLDKQIQQTLEQK